MAKSGEIAVIEASGGPLPQSDARRSGLLYKLAVVTPLALLIIYAMGWVAAVQQYQGVEGLVRWTDFKSTLTGATIIRDGDGPRLYDLQTQLDAQNRVLAPYIPQFPSPPYCRTTTSRSRRCSLHPSWACLIPSFSRCGRCSCCSPWGCRSG